MLYKTIERLRIDEIEGIVNEKFASFRQEFQTFMEHLRITNPPPYDEAVESAYPLIAWLREYELQIPESWNEDLEYNLIDYFVMNLPDALHKLRNANGVMLKSDIEFKEFSHEFHDETEIIESETYKKILISVCMAIHRCFPTDDLSDLPDLITEEEQDFATTRAAASAKATTIADTIVKEFEADLADDYCVNVYDLKCLMDDEETWDRWDVEKVIQLKNKISYYEKRHNKGNIR